MIGQWECRALIAARFNGSSYSDWRKFHPLQVDAT